MHNNQPDTKQEFDSRECMFWIFFVMNTPNLLIEEMLIFKNILHFKYFMVDILIKTSLRDVFGTLKYKD